MKYALKVEIPSLSDEHAVEIPGLGAVFNHGVYAIEEQRQQLFQQVMGYPLEEANFQTGIELIELTEEHVTAASDIKVPEQKPGEGQEESSESNEEEKGDS